MKITVAVDTVITSVQAQVALMVAGASHLAFEKIPPVLHDGHSAALTRVISDAALVAALRLRGAGAAGCTLDVADNILVFSFADDAALPEPALVQAALVRAVAGYTLHVVFGAAGICADFYADALDALSLVGGYDSARIAFNG